MFITTVKFNNEPRSQCLHNNIILYSVFLVEKKRFTTKNHDFNKII